MNGFKKVRKSRLWFLQFFFMLVFFQLLVVSTESLVLFKDAPGTGYSNSCKRWITTVRTVSVMFCHVEPDDSLIKMVASAFPVTLNNSAQSHLRVTYSSTNVPVDYVIFTDSYGTNPLEACVSRAIPSHLLGERRTVIVCDMSPRFPGELKRMESLKFLGLASVLYLTTTHCWGATPFHFLHRTFIRQADCDSSRWRFSDEYLPDMEGKTVRVAIFNKPVFSVIDQNEPRLEKRYGGLEVDIFKNVVHLLNLTWEAVELVQDDDVWGTLVDSQWRGGVMEALTLGDADVGLVSMDVVYNLNEYIDFTIHWATLKDVFLAPRPHRLPVTWANIVRPFTRAVWYALAVSTVVASLVGWFLHWLNAKIFRHHPQWRTPSLVEYHMHALGSLTGANYRLPNSFKKPPVILIMFIFWLMFVQTMNYAFTSQLASSLAMSFKSTKIDSIRQLVEQNFTWVRPQSGVPGQTVVNIQDHWHKLWMKNWIVSNTPTDRRLIKSGRFAVFAQFMVESKTVVLFSPLDDDLVDGLRVVRESLRQHYSTTALRKNSPLRPFYNKIIGTLAEVGVLKALWKQSVSKYQKISYNKLVKDPDSSLNSEPIAITFDIFKYMLRILLFGLAVSSICFILELFVKFFFKKLDLSSGTNSKTRF